MKRSMILAMILMILILTSGSASADPVQPQIPTSENQTLQSFADTNKECREWTDECVTCLRKDDGTLGCSVPGIACEPKTLACREPKP